MSANNKNERSPRDLSVPETMKIAALLAELMPPGGLSSTTAKVSLQPELVDADEGSVPPIAPPALQIEDLDDLDVPTAAPPEPSDLPDDQIVDVATLGADPPDAGPPSTVFVAQLPPLLPQMVMPAAEEMVPPSLPPTTIPPPLLEAMAPAIGDAPVGDRPFEPPLAPAAMASVEPVQPASAGAPPADPELIPLGGLAAGSYFALVNWQNDPNRARHPRRSDFGLDEQTLAVARANPFYVTGQPRRPETRSVSEVLAEIGW